MPAHRGAALPVPQLRLYRFLDLCSLLDYRMVFSQLVMVLLRNGIVSAGSGLAGVAGSPQWVQWRCRCATCTEDTAHPHC